MKIQRKQRNLLLFFVGLAVLPTILLAPTYLNSSTTLINQQNGAISFPTPSVAIQGSNSTTLQLGPGSDGGAQYSLSVLRNLPIRFFIDDRGFNNSVILPQGINVKITVGGVTYSLERLSQLFNSGRIPANSTNPAIPTSGQSSLTVSYIVQASSAVPAGQYIISIVCLSFPSPTVFNPNPGATFRVTVDIS